MSTCKMCQFYTNKLSSVASFRFRDGVGECRRNAPRGPITIGWGKPGQDELENSGVMSPFPFVPDDDWCGEFQPRSPGAGMSP